MHALFHLMCVIGTVWQFIGIYFYVL